MSTDTDINILVVDDLEQNLIAAEALLARPGLNVIKASSGPEALEALLANEIALALVDVQMPNMDGFELAELIRGSERTRSVPLIFLTAGAREAKTTFRGYEAGAVDFLYKPVDAGALKSKVNVFVELHAKEKQLSHQLEELRQALYLNEMFTAVLGHDLRNPLAAVLNGAELMLMVSDNQRVKSAASRIQSSGRRMAKMVDQLLDVARIRSGGIELHVRETNYETVCRAIVEELVTAEQPDRIQVQKAGDLLGDADPDRLSQILSNLLANALQHGEPGKPVELHIDGSQAHEIRVRIANSGAIPPHLVAGVFEPFQAGQADRRPSQGLGLGLYIVKKFADLHGGGVAVKSSQAEGTVFTVTLPRRNPLRNRPAHAGPAGAPAFPGFRAGT